MGRLRFGHKTFWNIQFQHIKAVRVNDDNVECDRFEMGVSHGRFPLGGLVGKQPGRTSILRISQNESNESICSNKIIIYS